MPSVGFGWRRSALLTHIKSGSRSQPAWLRSKQGRSMAIATDFARALDPAMFARSAGYDLDTWQASVVRSAALRTLVNVHRQGGKDLTAAVEAVHVALYEADAPILLVSPSLRQSVELFRVCMAIYRATGAPVPPEAE